MQSLEDVDVFIKNNGCTSEATQVCHVGDLAAALSFSEDNTRRLPCNECTVSDVVNLDLEFTTMDEFYIDCISHACFKI